jgi:hypothetical protein
MRDISYCVPSTIADMAPYTCTPHRIHSRKRGRMRLIMPGIEIGRRQSLRLWWADIKVVGLR